MSSVLFTQLGTNSLDARNLEIAGAEKKMDGGKKVTDLTPVAPMAVEKLVTAQMNYYANNDQNVRSRSLFHATPIGIGWLLTLLARIIRIVVRTLGIPISLSVAAFQQSRYGEMENKGQKILKYNLIVEDLKRIGQEWVDLGTTLLSAAIGTVNTLAPGAISTEFLYQYYADRTAENIDKNNQFNAAKKAYLEQQEHKHQSWKNAIEKAKNEEIASMDKA